LLIEFIAPEIWEYVVIPLLIVLARIVDVTIGTLRIIFVSKGMKVIAPILGFFEVLVWLLAIGQVLQNLTSPINYLAYATGFAIGTYIGIAVEHKIAMGISLVRVITVRDASDLIDHLREIGQTVTVLDAEGIRGPVKVLFTIIKRRELKMIIETIREFNPRAFYTIEDIGFVNQSMIPTPREKRRILRMIGLIRK